MKRCLTYGLAVRAGANSVKCVALLLAVIVATAVGAPTAHAATARTFVSNVGTNNSTCGATTPCQTFAQAIAVTSSGGEINCLTPGGFGVVTITIPVTINCEGVLNGGITLTSGVAINVNAAGAVNLIGLDLNGTTGASVGVSVNTSGANVSIRKCKIYGWTTGVFHAGATLIVDNVVVINNNLGIEEYQNSSSSNMSVRNSTVSNNQTGIEVVVNGGTHSGATVEQTTIAFNADFGVLTYGAGAVAIIGGSAVVNNTTGVSAKSGGVVYSFKNNQIGGNGSDGTPLTALPGGPLN